MHISKAIVAGRMAPWLGVFKNGIEAWDVDRFLTADSISHHYFPYPALFSLGLHARKFYAGFCDIYFKKITRFTKNYEKRIKKKMANAFSMYGISYEDIVQNTLLKSYADKYEIVPVDAAEMPAERPKRGKSFDIPARKSGTQ